ncbi:MAG: hypothetical protein IJ083_10495, partial [Clostridia bacterium]|nr:hypothetical protein [Clostridia bacterium]
PFSQASVPFGSSAPLPRFSLSGICCLSFAFRFYIVFKVHSLSLASQLAYHNSESPSGQAVSKMFLPEVSLCRQKANKSFV